MTAIADQGDIMRFLTHIESDESQPFGPPPELFEAVGAFGHDDFTG